MTFLVPRPDALRVVLTALSALALLVVLAGPAFSARADDADPVGVWPLDPRPDVVATFDPPDDPWAAGHRGVDLAGRIGQPVRSALAGEVAFAGGIAGKPVVTVSHGDTRTTYEPVVASVPVGTRVAAGEVIGVLDLGASHCFPRACLHWGWRRGETYLDPLDLVGGGPVRLLPLWRDEPTAGGAWRPPVHPYAAWDPLVGEASDPAFPVSVLVARGIAGRGREGPPPGGRPLEPLP